METFLVRVVLLAHIVFKELYKETLQNMNVLIVLLKVRFGVQHPFCVSAKLTRF